VGREAGLTEEKLRALENYEESAVLSERERAVLRYADAMTSTPVEVPDELFQGLRRWFDERQLVELTESIAWENYRARFDHAFGAEAEGFSAGAYCPVPIGRSGTTPGPGGAT
jgi:alkylhydroperoxidase family enzyme